MATNSVPDAQADEEAKLQRAAFEKLPMSDQLRTSVLRSEGEGGKETIKQIDVTKLSLEDRRQVLDRILRHTEEDNERFLQKLRDRLDRVGIDLPKIEVRYHHLNIEAEEHLGSRATPSLPNYFQSIFEWPRRKLGFGQRMKTNILSDVSGILKPARLTLLLGPPGSGRTTFLRALSGRLSSELQVSGEVTYNGHDMNEFIPRRTAAYISQYEVQMSTLTVRENLDFYSQIQGVGNRYDMLTELAKREKELGIKAEADVDTFLKATAVTGLSSNLGTDYVMKCTGLDTCANTPIGDAMIRGISGGQKKRVSIAEMLVGPWKAFFMDEISTGLDSSTTFKITKMLQQIAHLMDNTIVVSLLQPPPETFMLFDDLILLAEGQIVYQGPCNDVLQFMAYMGFRCPKRKATADFLQEVTSRKDQEQYWAVNTIPYCYVPVSKFAEGFKMFHIGQSLTKELASPFEKSKSHPAALVRDKYAVSNLVLLKACLARERILMKRSVGIYISKVIQIATVGSVAGTLFLRTKMHHRTMNDATLYMGALFFTVFFAMAAGVPEISFLSARMPIYHKDKEMFLYPAWALSLPIFFLRIPWTVLEAGSLVITVYFLTGLAPEPGRFFTLFLVLILINQSTIGLCRFCAAVGRDKIMADNMSTVIYILSVLLGGFVLSRDKMPVWWKWASWGSIIFYGQEAAGVNEYLSKEWEKPFGNNITLGKAALKLLGLETGKSWVYISLGALLGFVVLLNILFTLSFQYIDKPPIVRSGTVKAHEALTKGSATGSPKFGIRALQTSPFHRGASEDAGEDDGVKKGKKGAVLAFFQPLSVTFDKINYYVDIPDPKLKEGVSDEKRDKRLQLLHNVSGTFQPGVLTALVGETGAGKTTLLDVLAGRKTVGYIEGEIYISGYPKQQSTFTRIAGYCEQNDIHSPNLTVKESLIFSAWMRLSPEEDLQMFVDEVMSLVELDAIRDFIVGLPGVSGLSAEQRKRLTIAVELVANPSIIFMDEPTSGLDARAAAIVMRAVRNIGDTGRTVVCTIHQPSIDIFEAFDELLLLKRGGQTLYAGPLGQYSEHLIAYFEAIPGVPKINEGSNPATWMMEVSSTSMESRLRVDFAEIYANSAAYEKNAAMVESLKNPAPKSRDIEFPTVYAQSFKVQCLACLWKMKISYWRNTTYTGVKILLTTFTALTIGSLYWGLGKKRETQQDVSNLVGAMYCIVVFLGFNSTTTILNVVVSERIVYYRERGAGMYSPLTYAFAQFVIELPYNLFQAFLYTVLVYSMIQFELQFAKVLWFFFFMYSTALVFVYYGMLCVAVTSNLVGAVILSTSLFSLFNLFAGFVIPRKQMPVWWSWLSWVMPSAWSVYGLVGSQLADVDTIIALPDSQGQSITVEEFLREYFGYEYSFLKYVALEQIMTVVCSGLAFALFIKYLNFQRR